MQNIKVCPKCNQVAPKSNNAFCPYDGTALVEMQPKQNQQWQQPPVIQSQIIPTPLAARPKNKITLQTYIWLGIIGFFILGSIIVSVSSKKVVRNETNVNKISTPSPSLTKTPIASNSSTLPLPSALSSKENLEAGKKALSNGDLGVARSYLSAIPKDAKEFVSAKQYLATLEKRERRKSIEYELKSVESEQAGNERALDLYENMEGSIGKSSYLNALKKKGELQLRHIQLERKLKSMP